MQTAKLPGAKPEPLVFRSSIRGVEPGAPTTRIDFAIEGGTESVEHARNDDENGGALALDGAEEFGGHGGVFEDDRGPEGGRCLPP